MHVDKRERRITGTGGKNKTVLMGILERDGQVYASVVPNRKKNALQSAEWPLEAREARRLTLRRFFC